MLSSELESAVRGQRNPRIGIMDLVAALTLGQWETASRLLRANPEVINSGVLHLLAKRNDVAAAKWLLDHDADPTARWAHWDSEVTPLHLAIFGDHPAMVHLLLEAGANPSIHDSKHDADAMGWADFFGRTEIVKMLRGHARS